MSDMTESQVRDLIRQEMRALRAQLSRAPSGNHDAAEALRLVRNAIDERFPESPREAAERIEEYVIQRAARGSWWELDNIGEALGCRRVEMQNDEYAEALLKRRAQLLAEEE